MGNDTTALHGFQKMYKKFWNIELENTLKIMEYQIKRGDMPQLEKLPVKMLYFVFF